MARTAYRCIDCLQSFTGPSVPKAIDRFLTSPKHECVQRTNALDVVVGNFGPYSRVGVKR